MNDLLRLSAFQMAEKIAAKEISPSELLAVHIARIEQVNPALNAMVEDDFVRARKLAKEQEDILAKGGEKLPPLFGVPFTVKEMFSYTGMKRTGGSIHHKNDVMDWDATIVARMKKAGGIPLGTTNVPELGFWYETYNPVYGRTNNPYDLDRTPGGSSGGEAALLGAGATSIGLGSDIGGSIRMPAFFCGVFGHKPTRHLLPLTGHFPFSLNDFKTSLTEKYPYTSMGPMTRMASDLRPVMEILMGPDGHDPATTPRVPFKKPVTNWAKRKVVVCADPVFHAARGTEPELMQVVKNCESLFRELGADVVQLDPRFFVHSLDLWFAALNSTKNKFFYEILRGPDENFSVPKELFKLIIGKPDYILPSLVVSALEKLDPKGKNLDDDLKALAKMKADLEHILGDDGILLLPPHPRVAPRHQSPLWSPFDFISAGIFTTLGLPATSIPMGLNEEGLPLGVQVVAKSGNDHLNFSCAELLEQIFGGWTPPPKL